MGINNKLKIIFQVNYFSKHISSFLEYAEDYFVKSELKIFFTWVG
jgi:hypothetical protein